METLQVERDGGVVTVTFDRPEKKNAINGLMFDELRQVFREIGASNDDRAVVITGAGGDFCAGADLTDPSRGEKHQLAFMRGVADMILALHDLPQPTIAKVPGVAVGIGCNIALHCDLIVASDEARFSEIFAKRGLIVDGGGTWLLPRLLGIHRAKELALFADIISAKEAADLGLVNRVVPAAELDAFVDDWARRLASGPPIALGMTKKLLNEGLTSTLAQALEAEAMGQTITVTTEDTQEALAAFIQKRDPVFKGR
jgi:2-(1,2-epoxy-1,2-dihydrophenyl)acetyl-CoA isomerase